MSEPVRHELVRSEERTPGTWFAVCLCGKQFHAKREFQALASLEGHVRNKTKQPCPNPAKAAYRTRADAERDLPRRWAEHSWGTLEHTALPMPVRALAFHKPTEGRQLISEPKETMTIPEAIAAAQALIAERGIDLSAARLAYKSMHPNIDSDRIDLALTLEVATISKLVEPFTVESVARQLVAESGAFPWDGPVGNGLTLDEYRDRFRDIARDTVFLMGQLGFTEEADRG